MAGQVPTDCVVLAVDPGRDKCGIAVVGHRSGVLHREVRTTADLVPRVQDLAARFAVEALVVGDRTTSRLVAAALSGLQSLPEPMPIDEAGSSLAARERWRREVPPRGWQRLVPAVFRFPREPIDDWAAVILAERYLAARSGK